jgi:hypothetical protein
VLPLARFLGTLASTAMTNALAYYMAVLIVKAKSFIVGPQLVSQSPFGVLKPLFSVKNCMFGALNPMFGVLNPMFGVLNPIFDVLDPLPVVLNPEFGVLKLCPVF